MNHTVSLDDMQMRDGHLCIIKEQTELLSSGAQKTRLAAVRRTVTGRENGYSVEHAIRIRLCDCHPLPASSRNGANDIRCTAHGPSRSSAARWAGVP
jgi:hypothetical protein